MNKLVLRSASPEDLFDVGRLWARLDRFHRDIGLAFPQPEGAQQAWTASFERTLGRFSFLWVAEQDEEICAFLLARLKRTPAFLGGVLVGEISDLFVDERLRGQKVGARLVELAVEQLRARDVHSIEVQVLHNNVGGLAFWHRLGFELELSQFRLLLE